MIVSPEGGAGNMLTHTHWTIVLGRVFESNFSDSGIAQTDRFVVGRLAPDHGRHMLSMRG